MSKLQFDEATHSYTYDGVELTSATTFIKSLWPEFDENISYYTSEAVTKEIKAWKKGTELDPEDFPKSSKLFMNNWEEEVKQRKPRKTKKCTMDEVLHFWSEKGRIASEEGTRIHDLIEKALEGEVDLLEYIDEPEVLAAVNFANRMMNNVGADGIDAEKRVVGAEDSGTGVLRVPIAGTFDLALYRGNSVWIIDWKTNTNIHKGGYNYGVVDPVSKEKDSSIFIYTLQLSLYAYILERFYGYNIETLHIGWLHDGTCEPIQVEYKKELIEEILEECESLNSHDAELVSEELDL